MTVDVLVARMREPSVRIDVLGEAVPEGDRPRSRRRPSSPRYAASDPIWTT